MSRTEHIINRIAYFLVILTTLVFITISAWKHDGTIVFVEFMFFGSLLMIRKLFPKAPARRRSSSL